MCFPVNFAKFLTPSFIDTSGGCVWINLLLVAHVKDNFHQEYKHVFHFSKLWFCYTYERIFCQEYKHVFQFSKLWFCWSTVFCFSRLIFNALKLTILVVTWTTVKKQPSRGVLISNFIEFSLRHGCFPVNLLQIFGTPFLKRTSGRLLWQPWNWVIASGQH